MKSMVFGAAALSLATLAEAKFGYCSIVNCRYLAQTMVSQAQSHGSVGVAINGYGDDRQ